MIHIKRFLSPIYAPMARRFRRERALRRERRRIRAEARRTVEAGRPVKLIIGAGGTRYEGWIATDTPAFDVRKREDWARLFAPQSIDRLLAEHVFEHLTKAEFGEFLLCAREHLSARGRIRIAVPDGNHPDSDYIERVRPGGSGLGAADHKALYTCDLIGELLDQQGYQFELLEYFDAGGRFHRRSWSADDGYVGRSAEHDRRNQDGQLRYTSLIIDCWRKG